MSSIPDKKFVAGDVDIRHVYLINAIGRRIDVTALLQEINFYEDITSQFMTGNLTLLDSTSLAESFPLRGEEILVLDIETPSMETTPNVAMSRNSFFHIYKMGDRENISTKGVIFTLYFASVEAASNANSKLSRTYRGKISDIVKQIAKSPEGFNTIKDVIVEETVNNTIYTSNYWSPAKNIAYLTTQALNSANNPTYVSFEGNEGFVFASLEGLMARPSSITLVRDQNNATTNDALYSTVLDISSPVSYDYLARIDTGFYGGRTQHYDLETKRISFKDTMALGMRRYQMNKYSFIGTEEPATPLANLRTVGTTRSPHNDSPFLPIDTEVRRMSILSQISALSINIQVFGRLDYSVGQTIDLIVYKDTEVSTKDTEEQIVDPMLSGRYLITALNHNITKTKHLCNMELSKDSTISLSSNLTESTN